VAIKQLFGGSPGAGWGHRGAWGGTVPLHPASFCHPPCKQLAALKRLLAAEMNSWTGHPSPIFKEFKPVF